MRALTNSLKDLAILSPVCGILVLMTATVSFGGGSESLDPNLSRTLASHLTWAWTPDGCDDCEKAGVAASPKSILSASGEGLKGLLHDVSIHGEDDRVPTDDHRRSVVALAMGTVDQVRRGANWGTGSFIKVGTAGQCRFVLTAAHNVMDPNRGGVRSSNLSVFTDFDTNISPVDTVKEYSIGLSQLSPESLALPARQTSSTKESAAKVHLMKGCELKGSAFGPVDFMSGEVCDVAIIELNQPVKDCQELEVDPSAQVGSENLSLVGFHGDLFDDRFFQLSKSPSCGVVDLDRQVKLELDRYDIPQAGDFKPSQVVNLHTCDTKGKASGAPMLSPVGSVVGIHVGGDNEADHASDKTYNYMVRAQKCQGIHLMIQILSKGRECRSAIRHLPKIFYSK